MVLVERIESSKSIVAQLTDASANQSSSKHAVVECLEVLIVGAKVVLDGDLVGATAFCSSRHDW